MALTMSSQPRGVMRDCGDWPGMGLNRSASENGRPMKFVPIDPAGALLAVP
jgi:hypothetical protein